MRRVLAISILTISGMSAQTWWKADLHGGFSLVNTPGVGTSKRVTLNGWTASFTDYSIFPRWGLAAEFGGAEKDGVSQNVYLFGGTYRGLQKKRIALTGRILAGVTQANANTFTFGFGQSIDLRFTPQLALRVQPDLRFVRFPGKTSLVRPISVGLVYQFGKR
jgi:hypothetical protein